MKAVPGILPTLLEMICFFSTPTIDVEPEEIRARKSPETVDAPGFAPDASIPVTLYGAARQIRTADLILTKVVFRLSNNFSGSFSLKK